MQLQLTSGATGSPKISATPAIPMNSVTRPATFVTSIVVSERLAQPSPVALANQRSMPASADDSEPYGHLLNDEERHDQKKLQENQLHAELRARRRGSRDAAGFRVGEGDDQARSANGQVLQNGPPGATAASAWRAGVWGARCRRGGYRRGGSGCHWTS